MNAIGLTRFERSAAPQNLLTVPQYRALGQSLGVSWQTAARKRAMQQGGALVMRADGSLVVFTRHNGKVQQRTYPANKWAWEA